jgi:hypothetical protein
MSPPDCIGYLVAREVTRKITMKLKSWRRRRRRRRKRKEFRSHSIPCSTYFIPHLISYNNIPFRFNPLAS